MYKRKYTTVLYIGIEQYIAFVRTLRHHPDYEFVSIKMTYALCKDGIDHIRVIRESTCSISVEYFKWNWIK